MTKEQADRIIAILRSIDSSTTLIAIVIIASVVYAFLKSIGL